MDIAHLTNRKCSFLFFLNFHPFALVTSPILASRVQMFQLSVFKMGQTRLLFVYFRSFHMTYIAQI